MQGGWPRAFHHPDTLGLAVLRFDLLQEFAQRGFVGDVAGQHFVGELAVLESPIAAQIHDVIALYAKRSG